MINLQKSIRQILDILQELANHDRRVLPGHRDEALARYFEKNIDHNQYEKPLREIVSLLVRGAILTTDPLMLNQQAIVEHCANSVEILINTQQKLIEREEDLI